MVQSNALSRNCRVNVLTAFGKLDHFRTISNLFHFSRIGFILKVNKFLVQLIGFANSPILSANCIVNVPTAVGKLDHFIKLHI
jgi:hypothetical protein